MARVSPILTNFTGGEWSPLLYGRVDLAKYADSCETLENMIVRPHGGATRRPGLRFVAETSGKSRLIGFEYNTEQAYVLEFSDSRIRFYKDQGQILSAATVYEIASPYTSADLMGIKWAQEADAMYLVHPKYPTRKLARTGHASWTLDIVDWQDGPYLDVVEGTITPGATSGATTLTSPVDVWTLAMSGSPVRLLDSGGNWGWAKITAFQTAKVVSANVIGPVAAGACTSYRLGAWRSDRGYPRAITFFEQRLLLAGTPYDPQSIWGSEIGNYESMYPGTSAGPTDTDAFEFALAAEKMNAVLWLAAGRTLHIGTAGGEWTLGSSTANLPVTPTNVSVKRWTTHGSQDVQAEMIDTAGVFVARHGRKVRQLRYQYEIDGFTASDMSILSEHITKGKIVDMAWSAEPHGVLWLVRGDGLLIGLTFLPEQDVTCWHRHPTDGEVESVAVIPGEDRDEVWVSVKRTVGGVERHYVELMEGAWEDVRDARYLDSMLTLDDPVEITGATSANPVVITTGAAHGVVSGDSVYVDSVKGMTQLNNRSYDVLSAISATAFSVDVDGSAMSAYSAGGFIRKGVDSLSGLDHLAGRTVAILADGASHPDVAVNTSGEATLARTAYRVHAGLPYDSTIKTMSLEGGSEDGTSQGKKKRIHSCVVLFHETVGAQYGPQEDWLDRLEFRAPADPMDGPVRPFTGKKGVTFGSDWDRDARVVLRQDQPLPMTVLAIMPQLNVNDQ